MTKNNFLVLDLLTEENTDRLRSQKTIIADHTMI